MKSAHKTNEKSKNKPHDNLMMTDDRTQQVNKHQNMSGGTTSKRAQFNKTSQSYAHCYSR
jgi:hypothetical protein